MNMKSIITLFFLSLLIISCSSCKNNTDNTMKDKLDKVNDSNFSPSESSKLSPGTVKVRVLTSSINLEKEGLVNIVIDGVLGYGSSAPIIGKGEGMTLKITEKQKDKIILSSDSVNLIIKNQGAGRDQDSTNNWQLISIEE